MLKIPTIALVALMSLSPPQSPTAEIEALKREVAALKAQQVEMLRDLQAIKSLLQGLAQPRQGAQAPQGPEMPGLIGQSIPLAGEPTRGSSSARVTIVEVSDYHCPFCRRSAQQTLPQLDADYVRTGKAAYAFVDYPIAQLHPDAYRSHEAAACAGDQGKYWEMHQALFAGAPVRDVDALTAKAASIGVETGTFKACLTSGKHAAAVNASTERMAQLGIGGTPMTLIGLTPAPGQPMKIVQYVYGAKPYSEFKTAIDAVLAQAR
jgi:protein-disulfide isomerase